MQVAMGEMMDHILGEPSAGVRVSVSRPVVQTIATFVALGMASGLLGVALPGIEGRFAVPHHATGVIFTGMTAGFVLGSAASPRLTRRLGLQRALVASCMLLGVSLVSAASAPSWTLFVATMTIHGVAAGAIGTAVNRYAVGAFSPSAISWLHAGFGIGMAWSTAALSAMLGRGLSWQGGYLACALAAALLALWLGAARWLPDTARADEVLLTVPGAVTARLRRSAWLIGGLIALAAVEGVVGTWAVSVLVGRGLGADLTGAGATLYWTAFTGGRLLLGPMVGALGVRRIIRASTWSLLAGMLIFTYATHVVGSWIGLAIAGAAAAPLFPLTLAYAAERLGPERARRLTGAYAVTSNLSQAALASLAGAVAARWGTGALPLYLVVIGVALVILAEVTLPLVPGHHAAR